LWQKDEFEQICSRESLTEMAAEIEKTKHARERHDFDPRMFFMKIVFGIGARMAYD